MFCCWSILMLVLIVLLLLMMPQFILLLMQLFLFMVLTFLYWYQHWFVVGVYCLSILVLGTQCTFTIWFVDLFITFVDLFYNTIWFVDLFLCIDIEINISVVDDVWAISDTPFVDNVLMMMKIISTFNSWWVIIYLVPIKLKTLLLLL